MNRIRHKSNILKLLTKITLITLLLLLLGGCSMFERQEYEKRISRVSEVYPTEKVSDLFEKFPDYYLKLTPDEEPEIKFFGNKSEDESDKTYSSAYHTTSGKLRDTLRNNNQERE